MEFFIVSFVVVSFITWLVLIIKISRISRAFRDASDSSDRQASALEAYRDRMERIQGQVTPSANATVRRMAAIARSDA
ncbi:MAG: hypothetical protein U5K75_10950 [Ahrensia sp.]|nr:hypothetical protein [Ahrensia sp.]